MKKILYSLFSACAILLTGCFETTQETTINKDGSGLFSNTLDLSNMIGLLKQMGGDDAQKMQNADTTISLAGITDSIGEFTPEQKKIISKGTMKLTLNMQDEKLLIKLNVPFQKTSDIAMLKEVLPKISEAAMKKLPGTDQMPAGLGNSDSSKVKSFDDFFDVSYTNKLISKTLNKEKYAAEKDGDYMKSLQQMSDMGSPITANYIINLPRPAKKVEGKSIKLSEDKKKVFINVTSDDFFNDPSKFEYRIEY
ncbi:MAG: hypothetical protein ACHQF0_00450 [Chitinophagales bacterium]